MTANNKIHIQQGPILFFDLEYFVPKEDRPKQGYTMRYNPTLDDHIIIGGVFARYDPQKEKIGDVEPQEKWIWDCEGGEKQLLEEIYSIFRESWDIQISNKQELDLCGIGISKSDLPALYIRGVFHGIATPKELYETYFKTQHIELNSVAIPFEKEQKQMHPVCAKRIIKILLKEDDTKGSAKDVWEWYDNGDHEAIRARTKAEVEDCLRSYDEIADRIYIKEE